MAGNQIKRIITSILLIPLLIFIILLDRFSLFNLAVLAVILISSIEFFRLLETGGMPAFKTEGLLLSAIIPITFICGCPDIILFMITFVLIILFFKALTTKHPLTESMQLISATLLGIIYISLMISYLILIRQMDRGKYLILFLFVIVWMEDIVAYYTGTFWGRCPLCPQISPKKTAEGAIGGLIGGIAGALIFKAILLPDISILNTILLAFITSIFGQIGDLSESVIKRWAGVKDSGSILPGHGGLLDRIDALIFSAPVFYYFLIFILQWK